MQLFTSFLPWLYLAAGGYAGSLLFFALKKNRPAMALLCLGFMAHTGAIIAKGWSFGVFTPINMVSEQHFLPWCLAVMTLSRAAVAKRPLLPVPESMSIFLLTFAAILLPARIIPPSPLSSTTFATLFFFFEVFSHAFFLLAGLLAALFLTRRTGSQSFDTYATWGFILYSVAQVIGAVWSWMGWAVPFHWSERHLVSAATWCFYCAYLHLRFSSRWTTGGKAWLALWGAAIMLVSVYSYYLSSVVVKHG
jgi:hypothetical protein